VFGILGLEVDEGRLMGSCDVAGPSVAVPPRFGNILKHRKCFTKLSRKATRQRQQIERKPFKCLPHNRRQVKFIFLTNNMNFKGTWPNPRL